MTQPAVVFMAPDDQVEEVRDEGLGNVVGGTPLGTILHTDQPLLIMTSEVKKYQPLSKMTGGVKMTSLFQQ